MRWSIGGVVVAKEYKGRKALSYTFFIKRVINNNNIFDRSKCFRCLLPPPNHTIIIQYNIIFTYTHTHTHILVCLGFFDACLPSLGAIRVNAECVFMRVKSLLLTMLLCIIILYRSGRRCYRARVWNCFHAVRFESSDNPWTGKKFQLVMYRRDIPFYRHSLAYLARARIASTNIWFRVGLRTFPKIWQPRFRPFFTGVPHTAKFQNASPRSIPAMVCEKPRAPCADDYGHRRGTRNSEIRTKGRVRFGDESGHFRASDRVFRTCSFRFWERRPTDLFFPLEHTVRSPPSTTPGTYSEQKPLAFSQYRIDSSRTFCAGFQTSSSMHEPRAAPATRGT